MTEAGSCTSLHNCRHNDFQKAIMLNSIALLDSWTKAAFNPSQAINETIGAVRSASCPPTTITSTARRESTSHDTATQAAKEAVFNMLYQYQAIPVKAKILSDCILSTLDESEVTNLLDSAGWSRSDYLRGYRTTGCATHSSSSSTVEVTESVSGVYNDSHWLSDVSSLCFILPDKSDSIMPTSDVMEDLLNLVVGPNPTMYCTHL